MEICTHAHKQVFNRKLTAFWFGKALMKPELYFFHKMRHITVALSPYENFPIVGETFGSRFFSATGGMAKF